MKYLFERLSEPRPGTGEQFRLEDAVRDNVQRIAGSVRAPLDGTPGIFGFGLRSVVDIGRGSVSQREDYARQLAGLIAAWEPRLKDVEVLVEEDIVAPFRLVVSAHLDTGAEVEELRFPLEQL